jgi:biotin operon repressor
MSGWVKFHRKIEEWEWYSDANTFRLFFHLVMKANHKEGRWQGNIVKRGQHITSSEKLADELKLTRQQIRTALNKLKSTNEITIKSTSKFTLVTVENYSLYQSQDDVVTNKVTDKSTNEQPTDNQQITTNKNDKNDNKEKNIKTFLSDSNEYRLSELLFNLMRTNNPTCKEPNLQAWCKDVDLMIRVDKRTPDQIESMINFCQRDKFWKKNILSVSKLRNQFDRLTLDIDGSKSNTNTTLPTQNRKAVDF